MTGQPSRPRRWFNRRADRVASWLAGHDHHDQALWLWRACGLMAGNRAAQVNGDQR